MAHPDDIREASLRVAAGDARALARTLSLVENRGPGADALLAELFQLRRGARRIGVTGAPGSGKSTLVAALIGELRARGRRVAVLAVDPTSPFTGGAILGDRARMLAHATDPGVFIRSMASRGSLGGLAPAAADALTVLDAAGFDAILIETVGVGQAEVEVAGLADTTALVLTPGAGDDLQALKAGVMEIADVFVINKADLPGADDVERHLRGVLALRPAGDAAEPPIVRTVASEGRGVAELLDALERPASNRRLAGAYWRERLLDALRRGLAERLLPAVAPEAELAEAAERIAAGEMNPYGYVGEVLDRAVAGAPAGPRLHHLGVAVRSIDDALGFYRDALGLVVAHRAPVEAEAVEVAMLPVGKARIELLQPSNEASTIARFLDKRGPGLHHIALEVADLEAAAARLRDSGARLIGDGTGVGAEGYRYLFVHPASAGGVLIELVERQAPERFGARSAPLHNRGQ